MKNFALVIVASLAMLLAACGDNAEKKAEDNAATVVEQPQTQQLQTPTHEAVPADQSSDATGTPDTTGTIDTTGNMSNDNNQPAQ